MEMRNKLEMRGIVKDFPGQRALDEMDFVLCEGEIHALVGQNGAGKSTLIKILAGLYSKDAGEILLDSERIEVQNPRHAQELGFSFIHQELGLIPAFNSIENLMLGLRYPRTNLHLIDWSTTAKQAKEIASSMELSFDLRKPVRELSVSDKWLISIAGALIRDASVFVLDEPTSALTRDEVKKLFRTLEKLKEVGVSIIYISHRLNEIFEVADRVTVMKDGRKVATDDVRKLDKNRVISLMTGGKLADINRNGIFHKRGEKVLSVNNLGRKGVVEDVSFDLYAGEILGIAGLVGARRTDIFRMIFGADSRDSGEIYIDGSLVSIRSPREAIKHGLAMIPEDRRGQGLVQNMSLAKNVTLPWLEICRFIKTLNLINPRKEQGVARDAIKHLQIHTTGPAQHVKFLSGGNQQKVVLSKWLCKKAKVFIFDEPTKGIDVGAKEEFYTIMRQLASEGAGVVFISSDFSELVKMSDRTLVVRDGKIVTELSDEQITEGNILYCCYSDEV